MWGYVNRLLWNFDTQKMDHVWHSYEHPLIMYLLAMIIAKSMNLLNFSVRFDGWPCGLCH